MKKVVFVSTLYPETHYSRFLIESLQAITTEYAVFIYSEKRVGLENVPLKNVKKVFDQKLYYFLQILREVLKDKPSIVHLQHEVSMYGGISTVGFFPLLVLFLKLLGIKVVVTLHAVVSKEQIDYDFLQTFSFPPIRVFIFLTKIFFFYLYFSTSFLANKIIVHSNYMRQILCDDYFADANKVKVIPIGIQKGGTYDLSKGSFLKDSLKSKIQGKKIILFFGYIIRRKGLEYLIDALNTVRQQQKDFILILAGGSIPYQKNYPQEIQKMVDSLGLSDQVIFTSFISEGEINELFYLSYLVVLPYVYSISSSLPLSFALQYNKPVVASAIGTLREEVTELDCGILVPPRDSGSLAKAMLDLLQNNSLREEKITNIIESKKQRTWENMAEDTVKVYDGVL